MSKPTIQEISASAAKMQRGRLLSGRVLVRPDEALDRIGSILLPDQAKEKPRSGRVISVSPEPHRFENGMSAPVEVKVGDRVLYGRYGGIEYTDKEFNVEYIILAFNDSFMVLPESEAKNEQKTN